MPGGGSSRDSDGSRVRYGGTENARKAATTSSSGTIQGWRDQAFARWGGVVGVAVMVVRS
ncbi:hypothetical protein GCM10027199_83200 [Amycolatopsis magusensis]